MARSRLSNNGKGHQFSTELRQVNGSSSALEELYNRNANKLGMMRVRDHDEVTKEEKEHVLGARN